MAIEVHQISELSAGLSPWLPDPHPGIHVDAIWPRVRCAAPPRGSWTHCARLPRIYPWQLWPQCGLDEPEPVVVVAVRARVPVAVGGAQVDGIVVPTPATQNTAALSPDGVLILT